MKKVRWGILGTAQIAQNWIIPAIQASEANELVAIASRDLDKARRLAQYWHTPRAYGSYRELLADQEVDAVYVPVPNHLHVPLSIEALQAGKHVLCEKPLAMNAEEAETLRRAALEYPHLIVMEGFMYRFHPQWKKVQKMVAENALGTMRSVHAQFTYAAKHPKDIRNIPAWGGGGLMDIGSYCISAARLLFNEEPVRVCARRTLHAEFEVDTLASGILEFPQGFATFSCATEAEPSQLVTATGDEGSVYIESPFVLPDEDTPNRIVVNHKTISDTLEFFDSDHYVDMFDAFGKAVIGSEPAPTPLDDAVANMKVLDAVIASAERDEWVTIS
jgi:predicted dehydrogenase